jgi:hypothetical protein
VTVRETEAPALIRRSRLCLVGLGLLAAANAVSGPAQAQVTEPPKAALFPDPTKFAYGVYTQGDLGAVTVLGAVGGHLRPGFALGLAAGYDLTRWVAIEARAVGSSHITDFPTGPQDGELLQLYHLLGALKFSLRYRFLIVSLDGTAGVVRTSTNILSTVGLNDRRTSLAFGGGLGVDYHTLSRHFSFGVHAGYEQIPGLGKSGALTTTTCVRYSF